MFNSDFFIIGNGFDLAHNMRTKPKHFMLWLAENCRYDVIQELQSAYPTRTKDGFLLWTDFEKALGEYDINTVINWSWESLYLTEDSLGNQLFNQGLIDTQLPDIINEAFTKWVRSIQIAKVKAYDNISEDAIYLTFNYTDTLEELYHISEKQVLHIHGRASKGEKLIVGHNRQIDPADYWDDSIDFRENNERMQRLTNMNELCKPFDALLKQYDSFFAELGHVKEIYIKGHSCNSIDYPYFVKIKESVPEKVEWHFDPYDDSDNQRGLALINSIGVRYEQTTGLRK